MRVCAVRTRKRVVHIPFRNCCTTVVTRNGMSLAIREKAQFAISWNCRIRGFTSRRTGRISRVDSIELVFGEAQQCSGRIDIDPGVRHMHRNGCASIRDGDLFHGRYRILRRIENDGTGALYQALDMMTETHRILKVVQAETLGGAGIRVRFKRDAPLWDNGNVAYLSDAGLDQDTRSFFFIMELAEDSEIEPVTKQRVVHVGASSLSDKSPLPLPSDTPPAMRSGPLPLPLPPPMMSSASRSSQPVVPLPPPQLPPKKPLPSAPLMPGQSTSNFVHRWAFFAFAIALGGVMYFRTCAGSNESSPARMNTTITHAPENAAPISPAPASTNIEPNVAALGESQLPDASVPTNWVAKESTSAEKTPPEHTPSKEAPRDISPPKKASPQTASIPKKTPAAENKPATKTRQRESIF